jgi:hypothetical protein
MPRIAKPRWDKIRRRWYANIGERDESGRAREVFAPERIGERDEEKAWEWFKTERGRRQTAVPIDAVTVEWVCEHYLADAEERRDKGALPKGQYANMPGTWGSSPTSSGPGWPRRSSRTT